MNRIPVWLFLAMLPMFGFNLSSEKIVAKECKMTFDLGKGWVVANLKQQLFEDNDEDMPSDKSMEKVMLGFDMFDCHNDEKNLKRQMGIFLYKDKTLNIPEMDYYGVKFQEEGNGQKIQVDGVEWTSIIKDDEPEGYEDGYIYQLSAKIKKVNILIFAFYPKNMDEQREDIEIKALLASFKPL